MLLYTPGTGFFYNSQIIHAMVWEILVIAVNELNTKTIVHMHFVRFEEN